MHLPLCAGGRKACAAVTAPRPAGRASVTRCITARARRFSQSSISSVSVQQRTRGRYGRGRWRCVGVRRSGWAPAGRCFLLGKYDPLLVATARRAQGRTCVTTCGVAGFFSHAALRDANVMAQFSCRRDQVRCQRLDAWHGVMISARRACYKQHSGHARLRHHGRVVIPRLLVRSTLAYVNISDHRCHPITLPCPKERREDEKIARSRSIMLH